MIIFYTALRSMFVLFAGGVMASLIGLLINASCGSCTSPAPGFTNYVYSMIALTVVAGLAAYMLEMQLRKKGEWTRKGSFRLLLNYHRINASEGFEPVLPETRMRLASYIDGPRIWRAGLWIGIAFLGIVTLYVIEGQGFSSFWAHIALAVVVATVPNYLDYLKQRRQMLSGDRLRSGELVFIDAFGKLYVDIGIDGAILVPYTEDLAEEPFVVREISELAA